MKKYGIYLREKQKESLKNINWKIDSKHETKIKIGRDY